MLVAISAECSAPELGRESRTSLRERGTAKASRIVERDARREVLLAVNLDDHLVLVGEANEDPLRSDQHRIGADLGGLRSVALGHRGEDSTVAALLRGDTGLSLARAWPGASLAGEGAAEALHHLAERADPDAAQHAAGRGRARRALLDARHRALDGRSARDLLRAFEVVDAGIELRAALVRCATSSLILTHVLPSGVAAGAPFAMTTAPMSAAPTSPTPRIFFIDRRGS